LTTLGVCGSTQVHQQELSFLAFSSQYDDLTPSGATFAESPENIVYSTFNFDLDESTSNVTLVAEIIQVSPSRLCCSETHCATRAYISGVVVRCALALADLRCAMLLPWPMCSLSVVAVVASTMRIATSLPSISKYVT
jgi:hypothetical protein